MYQTMSVVLKKDHSLQPVFDEYTMLAKLMKNTCIYRMRQLFFTYTRDYDPANLDIAQLEVLKEFAQSDIPINKEHVFPNYAEFLRMLAITKNRDYYSNLPRQCSQ